MTDHLWTRDETAEHLRITPRTLLRWGDKGPPFVRLSPRVIRYRSADVLAWVDALQATTGTRADLLRGELDELEDDAKADDAQRAAQKKIRGEADAD